MRSATLVSSIDSLNAVGCSCTLDFGNLQQGSEDVGFGLDEKILSAPTASFHIYLHQI